MAACPTAKDRYRTQLVANKTRRTFDDTKKKSTTYQSGVNVKVTVSNSSVDLYVAQKPALSSCDQITIHSEAYAQVQNKCGGDHSCPSCSKIGRMQAKITTFSVHWLNHVSGVVASAAAESDLL